MLREILKLLAPNFHLSFGGGGGGDTETTQTTEPPSWQKPYIQDFMTQAQQQYQAPGPFYYPGNTVANMNPIQQAGIAGATEYGQGGAQNVANQAQNAYSFGLNAANPLQNPFFHSTAQALINPLTETLQQQILPQIDSGAVQAGQVGSSRQGVAQGNAVQAYSRAAGDTLAKFGTNAYGQGLNTMLGTLGQTGTVNQAGLAPSQILSGVGDTLNNYEQRLIDANVNRFNYGQGLPQAELQNYTNLVGGTGFGGSAQGTQSGGQQSGGWSSALGGAAAGLAANSMLATAGSTAAAGSMTAGAAGLTAAAPWALPLILGFAAYNS